MLDRVRERLLAERLPNGHWEGELSSSALSTATAVVALALVDRVRYEKWILRGVEWISQHQNADGGWGDTVFSVSNISTTSLCWAALGLMNRPCPAADAWLVKHAGSIEPEPLAKSIIARYGKDRTFSTPILTMNALTGRLGTGAAAWKHIIQLPFELAVLPPELFRWLQLPVVSYALPALIAIGQVRYYHCPSFNFLKYFARARSLQVLEKMTPESGGFLEAIPLTSFVTMSLAAMGLKHHAVAQAGAKFLISVARPDGSWPIDTNLSTWVTTLSVNALGEDLPVTAQSPIRDWLLGQQYHEVHPFTNADPGGWSWTDLSGGVPDADDTAGVLLALKNLGVCDDRVLDAVIRGIHWLLGLQNRDGGIPTFCHGWGALPFDRSSPDITAHTLRAFACWQSQLPVSWQRRIQKSTHRAIQFLVRTQCPDGAWAPLWFGNQWAPQEENLTYGTTNVLIALQSLNGFAGHPMQARAIHWLVNAQNPDGSWGGASQSTPSIEETALAIRALSGTGHNDVIRRGLQWLIDVTQEGQSLKPAPIGLYFAKLWYYEKLYPLIYVTAALNQMTVMP